MSWLTNNVGDFVLVQEMKIEYSRSQANLKEKMLFSLVKECGGLVQNNGDWWARDGAKEHFSFRSMISRRTQRIIDYLSDILMLTRSFSSIRAPELPSTK